MSAIRSEIIREGEWLWRSARPGKVARLYIHTDAANIPLELSQSELEQLPPDGCFKIKPTHPNYNTLFS